MICPGCNKEKTSVKKSKITGKMLCGFCRMEEYQKASAERELARLFRGAY